MIQNIQAIWNIMKRPKLRIIGIEEDRKSQMQRSENIFNKITEENFPNLNKKMPINIQEAYRIAIRLDQKRKSSHHIIIKTQNLENKERILKASRGKKGSEHIQVGLLLELHLTSQQRF